MIDWNIDWHVHQNTYIVSLTTRAALQISTYSEGSKCFTIKTFTVSFSFSHSCLLQFFRSVKLLQNFLCFSKVLESSKVGPSGRIRTEQNISKSIFAKTITSNHLLRFQRVNLPNPRLFRFLKFLCYPWTFLCFSKVLEASKVGPSEGITAG